MNTVASQTATAVMITWMTIFMPSYCHPTRGRAVDLPRNTLGVNTVAPLDCPDQSWHDLHGAMGDRGMVDASGLAAAAGLRSGDGRLDQNRLPAKARQAATDRAGQPSPSAWPYSVGHGW